MKSVGGPLQFRWMYSYKSHNAVGLRSWITRRRKSGKGRLLNASGTWYLRRWRKKIIDEIQLNWKDTCRPSNQPNPLRKGQLKIDKIKSLQDPSQLLNRHGNWQKEMERGLVRYKYISNSTLENKVTGWIWSFKANVFIVGSLSGWWCLVPRSYGGHQQERYCLWYGERIRSLLRAAHFSLPFFENRIPLLYFPKWKPGWRS